jgi:hypothetical protein
MGSCSWKFRAPFFTVLIVRFLPLIIGKPTAAGRTPLRSEVGADGL